MAVTSDLLSHLELLDTTVVMTKSQKCFMTCFCLLLLLLSVIIVMHFDNYLHKITARQVGYKRNVTIMTLFLL